MYYRNAAAAVVVYDVTSAVRLIMPYATGPCELQLTLCFHQTSLEKAKSWVKELQRQANPNIVIAFSKRAKSQDLGPL